MSDRDWTVLLIGGHSASGKTVVAERIGLPLGVHWMMVDDLRLAFQRARARLPTGGNALYFEYLFPLASQNLMWWPVLSRTSSFPDAETG